MRDTEPDDKFDGPADETPADREAILDEISEGGPVAPADNSNDDRD